MKKTLYPKTERIGEQKVIITEKLDGSNLGIFKFDGEVYFAQRNHVFKMDELNKQNAYKGLIGWAEENKDALNTILDNSCIFGEWIGMGQIGYGDSDINKRFYMFAKANIDDNLDASRLNYNHDLFIYPFKDQVMPDCIGVVPVVIENNSLLSLDSLNDLYTTYCKKVDRGVEGFVVSLGAGVKKYVRLKRGVISEHKQ